VLDVGVSPRESGINQKPRSGDTTRDTAPSGRVELASVRVVLAFRPASKSFIYEPEPALAGDTECATKSFLATCSADDKKLTNYSLPAAW
jgi:hypothetical protein